MFKRFILFNCLIAVFSLAAFAQTGEVVFSKSAKAAEKADEFSSGEYIYAHLKFAKPLASMLTVSDKPVTLIAEYHSKGKMIDDEMFGFEPARVSASKAATVVLPVISDPSADVPLFGKNLFSARLPATLAALPAGRHEIELKLMSFNYKDGTEPLATGKFVLVTDATSRAFFAQNAKDSTAAFSKRGITSVIVSERDQAMGVVGGKDVITLVNNCGRSVWMRKATGSDKREYRLSAGQTMLYDRDGSVLEEWNFGTQKWTTVTRAFSADSAGKANICGK